MKEKIKVNGTYQFPYIMKASWGMYIVFLIIFIPLIALFIFVPGSNIWLVSVTSLVFIGCLVSVEKTKIDLTSHGFVYKTLLTKNEIAYQDIKSLEVKIGSMRKRNRSAKFLNVVDSKHNDPLEIGVDTFDKRDAAILVDAIYSNNKNVKMDEYTKDIMESNFRPLLTYQLKKGLLPLVLFISILEIGLALFRLFSTK